MEWGIGLAMKDDCPAYLEAVASAVSFYTSLGFVVVEGIKLRLPLDDSGTTGEKLLASMAANLP